MWSMLWRLVVAIILFSVMVEGLAFGIQLLNYPDDLAVILGVVLSVLSILVPMGASFRWLRF